MIRFKDIAGIEKESILQEKCLENLVKVSRKNIINQMDSCDWNEMLIAPEISSRKYFRWTLSLNKDQVMRKNENECNQDLISLRHEIYSWVIGVTDNHLDFNYYRLLKIYNLFLKHIVHLEKFQGHPCHPSVIYHDLLVIPNDKKEKKILEGNYVSYILWEDIGEKSFFKEASQRLIIDKDLSLIQEIVPVWSFLISIDKTNYISHVDDLQFTFEKFYQEIDMTIELLKEFFQFLDKDIDLLFSDIRQRWKSIVNQLIQQPQVFCHRDFHSRNIYLHSRTQTWCFIDFQDARLGPYLYDIASFIEDPYLLTSFQEKDEMWTFWKSVLLHPERHQQKWTSNMEKILKERHLDQIEIDYLYTSLQRLFKALGSFLHAYINKGDPTYLIHVQNVWLRLLNLCQKSELTHQLGLLLKDLYYKTRHL